MHVLLMMFVLLTPAASTTTDDRIIATVGSEKIMYGQIFCDRALLEQDPRWLRGQTVEQACRNYEQEEFRRVLAREAVRAACRVEECHLSDEDIEPYRSAVLRDDALLQRLVTEARRIPGAIRRVYLGETIDTVYESDIKSRGYSLEQFKREVARFRSLEVVERFLAKDFAASARRQYEEQARDRALKAWLRNRLEELSRAEKRTLEETADLFLKRLVAKAPIVIEDRQFTIPEGRTILL
jgi:hypothetical protein